MEQAPHQAGRDDYKTSIDGVSSLDFNFLDADEEETEATAEYETSTLERPPAFMNADNSLPGKIVSTIKEIFNEVSPQEKNRRRSRSTFIGDRSRRRMGIPPQGS